MSKITKATWDAFLQAVADKADWERGGAAYGQLAEAYLQAETALDQGVAGDTLYQAWAAAREVRVQAQADEDQKWEAYRQATHARRQGGGVK